MINNMIKNILVVAIAMTQKYFKTRNKLTSCFDFCIQTNVLAQTETFTF